MLEIKNSVAVISGGARGLGLALAEYWVKNKGKVVLGDIFEEELYQASKKFGTSAKAMFCDVTKEDQCSKLGDLAISAFGKINLIAPFAGIIRDGFLFNIDRNSGKVKRKMNLNQFTSVIDVNLIGVFLTVRECAARMIDNQCKGLICLVSSIGALGTVGQINYSSSKAAVSIMPKVITSEFAHLGISKSIRCVAIAPGYVDTPILKGMKKSVLRKILEVVPIERLVKSEEIVSMVGELYRNEAITGDTYYVHGGLSKPNR